MNCLNEYQKAVKLARSNSFSAIISRSCHNSRVLFSTVNAVLHPVATPSLIPSANICEAFLHFFIGKVTGIRSQISSDSNDLIIPADPINHLTSFWPISLPQLKYVIAHMKPTRSPGDVIPSSLFNTVFDTIGPSILSILNNNLSSGVVPASFKHAVIQPLLKKNGLDPFNMSHFRPISKLYFISKVLEKIVSGQLNNFSMRNNIFDRFQSGFRAVHCTETALLRVSNDIFRGVDSGSCVVLLLLDLTAAFDTVDHNILVARLKNHVGVQGLALNWFSSYLKDRTAPLVCGVPQGSILGPI